MTPQRLTPEDALLGAFTAIDGTRPGERVTTIDFWTYADSVEGLAGTPGWSVYFGRSEGTAVPAEHRADEMTRARRTAVQKWTIWREQQLDALAQAKSQPTPDAEEIDRNARAYGWEVGRGRSMTEALTSSPDNPFLLKHWRTKLVDEEANDG